MGAGVQKYFVGSHTHTHVSVLAAAAEWREGDCAGGSLRPQGSAGLPAQPDRERPPRADGAAAGTPGPWKDRGRPRASE